MTITRDEMSPGSGKLYAADGTIFDQTALLKELQDQITGAGLNIAADISVDSLQIASPDGGTTKLYAKSDAAGNLKVIIEDAGDAASEATLALIKTAIDNINATVSGGRVLVTLPAAVTADITDTKTAVEALAALIDTGALTVDDPNSQTKLDSAIALLGTVDADTGAIKTATEALSALVDTGELKVKDLTSQGKLDSIITLLGNQAAIKTAVEALAALVDAGAFKVKDTDAQTKLDSIIADTADIETATEALAALISGGELLVSDADAQGKLDSITSLLGTIDTDTGNIDTSLDDIEEALEGPGNAVTFDSYLTIPMAETAGADKEIIAAPGAGKQIWVYGYAFTVDAAGSVSFQDDADAAVTGVMTFAANGGMAVAPAGNYNMPIHKLGTNKALEVDLVTSNLNGWITYSIVSV